MARKQQTPIMWESIVSTRGGGALPGWAGYVVATSPPTPLHGRWRGEAPPQACLPLGIVS